MPTKPGSDDVVPKKKPDTFFNRFSSMATKVTGSVYAFMVVLLVVVIWAVTGPVFKFSDTWQLVINTGNYNYYFFDGFRNSAFPE